MRAIVIAIVLVWSSMTRVAQAATITVTAFTDTTPGSPPGTGSGSAGELRTAMLASSPGDMIVFSCAAEPCVITLGGPLPLIGHDLTIDGGVEGDVIIDGNNAWRAFWVDTGTVAIRNLWVRNVVAHGGNGNYGGGGGAGLGAGIFVNQSTATLTVTNVAFLYPSAIGGNGSGDAGSICGGGGGLGGDGGGLGVSGGLGGGGGGLLGAASGGIGGNGYSGGGGAPGGDGGFGGGGGGAQDARCGSGGFGGGGGGSYRTPGGDGCSGGFGGGGGSGFNGAGGGTGGPGGFGGGGGAGPTAGSGAGAFGVHGGNSTATAGGFGGGGGGAGGPAIFNNEGTVTITTSVVLGASATAGTGGAPTADATAVFNFAGMVNGFATTGPIASALPSAILPTALTDGMVDTGYSATFTAWHGQPPYTFVVTAGALPAGLAVATSGALTGTPSAGGAFSFTIAATDSNSHSLSLAYSLTVAIQAAQTITFAGPGDQMLATGTVEVSATASSGLPVTFTSETASVCTVSGPTVTLVAAGTCTVQASQAGDIDYAAAANVSASFSVEGAAGGGGGGCGCTVGGAAPSAAESVLWLLACLALTAAFLRTKKRRNRSRGDSGWQVSS